MENNEEFVIELTNCQSQLRAYIYTLTNGSDHMMDIVQETNLELWRKSSEWQSGTNFVAWAVTIARFKTLSHFRDKSRDRHVFDPDIMEMLADSVEEIIGEVPQRQIALKSCISKLTSDQQGILKARYFQGQSVKAVSEQFDRSEDGIKSLMRRVRNNLRNCIDQELKAQQP